jgi:hypothetical protein
VHSAKRIESFNDFAMRYALCALRHLIEGKAYKGDNGLCLWSERLTIFKKSTLVGIKDFEHGIDGW